MVRTAALASTLHRTLEYFIARKSMPECLASGGHAAR
jgi:hypothetical protein